MAAELNPELELARHIGRFRDNPLGFVLFAFPWGQPGELAGYDGPDEWQRELLQAIGELVKARAFNGTDPVAPIRVAVTSGHGIGKSVLVAWLVLWIMSTRPGAQGTVTANTFQQLDTRTWAQIRRWAKLCVTAHWWNIGAGAMTCKFARSPKDWQSSPQSCREENSEAFAGQHAATSTSFYIFDEASAIPDKIFEVAEGGLTDGEPMIFCFGNPTRNTGKLYSICFGSERGRWLVRCIDSRQARFTNKAQIQEWIDDYGEDSDFVRVRVRGLPPTASDMQFIDLKRVAEAQRRQVEVLPDEPLIMGVDVARGGADSNVIRFRRGLDARSIPPIKIHGEATRDSMLLVARLANIITERRPAVTFLDATGVGGPIGDRLRQLGYKVIDVQFGGTPPNPRYANMRSYMWAQMKDWLLRGAIDADSQLEIDLTGPGYGHDKKDRLLLESKESMKARGLDSPDNGDALAITFARPVAPPRPKPVVIPDSYYYGTSDYNGEFS
jgi:hypothetical protein